MVIKVCIICGAELIGRQTKLCSNRECHRKRNTENVYEKRRSLRGTNVCAICGKNLPKRRRKYCSDFCAMEERRRVDREGKKERYKNDIEWRNARLKREREKYQNDLEYRDHILELMRKKYENDAKYRERANKSSGEWRRKQYRLDRGLPEDADLHKESSIERITREWLQENNIEFEQQYFINLENSTWTWVDFYIPESSTCLYVDGNYYHLPLEVQKRDENQNRILPQMGYNVIRLSENDILNGIRPNFEKNLEGELKLL